MCHCIQYLHVLYLFLKLCQRIPSKYAVHYDISYHDGFIFVVIGCYLSAQHTGFYRAGFYLARCNFCNNGWISVISEQIVQKFDVWLTMHRSSMWIKKPTRCHLVLYLFLLYKLLFISCWTCFGPPCAHLQELTTWWHFFTCGVVLWLCRQSDPVGWTYNQPTGSDCLHSHGTTPHVKKCH